MLTADGVLAQQTQATIDLPFALALGQADHLMRVTCFEWDADILDHMQTVKAGIERDDVRARIDQLLANLFGATRGIMGIAHRQWQHEDVPLQQLDVFGRVGVCDLIGLNGGLGLTTICGVIRLQRQWFAFRMSIDEQGAAMEAK